MKIKSIKKIMTSKVHTVSPGTLASEAIEVMRTEEISCLLVARDKKPMGIFTERDIVRGVHGGVSFHTVEIGKLVSTPVITAKSDIDICEAYNIISANEIRHLAIVNSKDEIIGIVTQTDMVKNLGTEYFVEFKKVAKIMTKTVEHVKKEQTVHEAVCRMAEASVSCIIVKGKNRPVGILTERDVVRLLCSGIDLKTLKMKDAMSQPVIAVNRDDSIFTTVKVMNQKNIRRVIVIDRVGKVEGLITRFDLIKGLETEYIKSLRELIKEKDKRLLESVKMFQEKINYFDNILRNAIDYAIATTDKDFHITYLNPMAEKLYSFKAKDVTGKKVLQIIPEESKPTPEQFEKALEIIKKNGEYQYTTELKTADRTIHIESRIAAICDSDKKLIGYAHFSKDVTEQKKIEKILKESEERYRMLIEGARVIGWEFDPGKNQFTFVSEKAEEITGYAPEKWYEKGFWTSHIHPKDRKSAKEYCASASEKCMDHEFEYRMLTANGEYLWVKDIVQVISEKGKAVMLRGVLIDISELKQAEEALRKSEKLYRLIMDNINMGITYIDTNYEVIMVNRFHSSLLKKLPRDFIGKKCFNEFEKREEVCSHCPGTVAMTTRKPASVDAEGILDDGSRVSVHINSFPVTDIDGRITGFIEVVEDITGRKKAEEELKNTYDELKKKSIRLEKFQKITVGRELEMIKLKKEINKILEDMGKPKKY